MSKAIKDMLVDDLKGRLVGVGDVIVVSLGKLDAQKTTQLRQSLRKKRISLQLVKNSLARRAMADTPLAPAFDQAEGMLAIAWGGEDVVDLAKELDRLQGVKDFEGFECRGGALDGPRLKQGSSSPGLRTSKRPVAGRRQPPDPVLPRDFWGRASLRDFSWYDNGLGWRAPGSVPRRYDTPHRHFTYHIQRPPDPPASPQISKGKDLERWQRLKRLVNSRRRPRTSATRSSASR